MSGTRYFNFPVALLQDFMANSQKCLNDIMYYSVYAHSARLNYGDEVLRIRQSVVHYGLPVNSSELIVLNGKLLYESIPKASPMSGISTKMFYEFLTNEKKEFEKICLLGFLALKSIIGKKPYCKVDNKFWLSRMAGNSKSVDLEQLPDIIKKYSSEYMTKKIKSELKKHWGLKSYSRYTRGFYVSFDMKFEALVNEVEMKRKGLKEKQLREAENAIVAKVLEKLHTPKIALQESEPPASIRKIGAFSLKQARNLHTK
ncbi:hypothetical protein [Flavobacterium suzhouense]|uniref:Initiator Replication protein n=1 Tax=Flavobacterium suzhouense TaxID=1529638 RepID=A0ABW5NTI8_9FLAO